MKRDWNNYIKQNSNHKIYHSDCQLVTAVNAYHYLTGKIINQDSKEYRELAELGLCKHGSCICIEKVWNELGIEEDKRFKSYDLEKYLKKNCSMEVSIWHKFFGFHSVSIVDYIKKANCVRITNFKHVTTSLPGGWIFLEDLKPHLRLNPDNSEPRYEFRTYKIK